MLRTQEGLWVHGVCALYTPGVSLAAAEGAEDAASWLAVGVPAVLARAAAAASVCAVCGGKCGACAPCASPGCGEAVHASCALRQGLRLGSVTHFGAERYFVLCPRHSAATSPAHAPEPVARADSPVDEAALGSGKASGLAQSLEDEFAEEAARRRESKASKLMRLSGSAAQAKAKGVRQADSWWAALPEYVPPVAWPTLLPVGTVRASYDARRWRVSYGDGAQQVWEPLLAGSDALERDERDLHDGTASPVIELFELGAAEVELKLGSGAAEAGWTIVEAYVGARKAGNWRYVSPRGLKFKTITQAVAERAGGGDLVPRVKLVMSRGGDPPGGDAADMPSDGARTTGGKGLKAPAPDAPQS